MKKKLIMKENENVIWINNNVNNNNNNENKWY